MKMCKKNNKHRQGFTLIELLGVILLIAMLLSISMVAASKLIKVAKKHQIEVQKRTLTSVLMRYHDIYKKWPHLTQGQQNGATWTFHNGRGEWYDEGVTYDGNNHNVLDCLLLKNSANSDNIVFIDETGFSYWSSSKSKIMRISAREGSDTGPWCFRDPDDGELKYFRISIYPVDNKVEVGTGSIFRP